MKKLMIAAAAAAMIGGAFADAIVYDIKISGKKSVTANGVANVTRDYGRTGWASEADETYVWVAQSPMVSHFGQGVH